MSIVDDLNHKILTITVSANTELNTPERAYTVSIEKIDKTRVGDVIELFQLYLKHYKYINYTDEECYNFLSRRLSTHGHIFIAYLHVDDKVENDNNNNNKIPIGFTQLYPSYSSLAMEENFILNDLYVKDEYRSLKLGTQIIQHIFKWADAQGAFKLFIQTTVNNQRTQYLYPKLGFKEYNRYEDTIEYCYKFDRAKNKVYHSYFE